MGFSSVDGRNPCPADPQLSAGKSVPFKPHPGESWNLAGDIPKGVYRTRRRCRGRSGLASRPLAVAVLPHADAHLIKIVRSRHACYFRSRYKAEVSWSSRFSSPLPSRHFRHRSSPHCRPGKAVSSSIDRERSVWSTDAPFPVMPMGYSWLVDIVTNEEPTCVLSQL